MFQFLHALTDRVRMLFAADAALALEAEFVSRDAERRADLLRQAERYAAEGLHGLAGHLRHQAAALSSQPSPVSVLPSLVDEHAEQTVRTTAARLLPNLTDLASPGVEPLPAPASRLIKKGRKR